tara:strand:- start:439 stop:669 length:231 start_codon:yes stop_codon:yes gene_type:complete
MPGEPRLLLSLLRFQLQLRLLAGVLRHLKLLLQPVLLQLLLPWHPVILVLLEVHLPLLLRSVSSFFPFFGVLKAKT